MIVNSFNIYNASKNANYSKVNAESNNKFSNENLKSDSLMHPISKFYSCFNASNPISLSFKAAKNLSSYDMDIKPQLKLCRNINKDAKNSELALKDVLDNYIAPINKNLSEDEKLITYTTRIKSPESIQEKVVSKYAKIGKDDKKLFGKELFNILFKCYDIKDGHTKDEINVRIQTIAENIYFLKHVPPYKNEKIYVDYFVQKLESENFIKLKEGCKNREEEIDYMAKILEQKTNGEHCIKNKYIDTESNEGIKHYAKDIVGARIVLNNSDIKTVQKVIDGLRRASNDGVLNIVSVENHVPDYKRLPKSKKISNYEYLPSCRLKSFADDTNSVYKKSDSKSGYMAIHVNVDLSGDALKLNSGKIKDRNKYNGFSGEIQIVDKNIKTLKEVEDLCYKLKDNKNSFKPKYKPFKEYFIANHKTQETIDAFDDYTFKSYIMQWERSKSGDKNSNSLPSISDFDFGYVKDKKFRNLDFNKLLLEKIKCELNQDEQISNLREIQNIKDKEKKINELSELSEENNINKTDNVKNKKDKKEINNENIENNENNENDENNKGIVNFVKNKFNKICSLLGVL